MIVSHDLASLKRLCSRILWLDHGRIRMSGPAGEVVPAYLAHMQENRSSGRRDCPSFVVFLTPMQAADRVNEKPDYTARG